MRARVQVVVLLLALLSCLAAPRVESQNLGFRFVPPVNNLAVAGSHRVTWESPGIILDPGLTSLTWFYASQPDGADRKRMVTGAKYDFKNGFRTEWQANGGFLFDWKVDEDREKKIWFLRTPRGGGEIIANDPVPADFVLSAMVRPTHLAEEFGLRFRGQPGGEFMELRFIPRDNQLQLIGKGLKPAIWRMPPMRLRQWHWVEVGVRNFKREVETRVRIYDETRRNVLFSDSYNGRPDKVLVNNRPGLIALVPFAEYADIYLDRWESRWLDGSARELRWDTSRVPNGKYFLVVELHTGRGAPQTVVSDFQVEVRNPGQAALIQ